MKVQPLPRKRHPLKVLAKASAPAAEIGNLDEKAEEYPIYFDIYFEFLLLCYIMFIIF